VAVNDSQTFGAMVEGMELISNLITRCAIFEELYLRTTAVTKTGAVVKDQLSQAIVKLYIAILKYLSNAKRYYGRHTAGALIFFFAPNVPC
jgi:hypothetical protein